jgi:hypothetical protein
MMNILFVAFEFPPLSRGGVHRPLAMVKYLPSFDIRPVVITLDQASYKDTYDIYGFDENLGKETLESADMVTVAADKPRRLSAMEEFISIYFSIHGNEVNYWKKNFFAAAEKAIEKYKPTLIFATVPPFSVLPLVHALAKKHQLPLVLDFRDAWSQWRTIPYGSIFHYWKTLAYERRYLLVADAVIATSHQTLDDFRQLHHKVPASKFYYIPNGYDGEMMEWQPQIANKSDYTIGYVGSFYYSPVARKQMLKPWWKKRAHRILQYIPHKQDWLYRSPYFFFKAMKQFNSAYPDLEKRIKVKFAGKKQDWLQEMIREFGLEQQVTLMGEISHKESLLFQRECDALLITSAKQFGGRDYSIAGKTFEYLQMQRPIIAFVCEGAQKDLLENAGTALLCNPDNTEESVKQLAELFNGQISLKPVDSFLKGLSRAALTERLSEILKKISRHI